MGVKLLATLGNNERTTNQPTDRQCTMYDAIENIILRFIERTNNKQPTNRPTMYNVRCNREYYIKVYPTASINRIFVKKELYKVIVH